MIRHLDILSLYKKRIIRHHKTKLVQTYFSLYAWFWFHTEFWIKDPEKRRPYTYIMRDWIYPHMKAFISILIIWYVGIGGWMAYCLLDQHLIQGLVVLAIGIFSGWLAAHLVWGGKWVQGEQEWPPILDA